MFDNFGRNNSALFTLLTLVIFSVVFGWMVGVAMQRIKMHEFVELPK